jgi:holo-[acyl-carrier protein] synthase
MIRAVGIDTECIARIGRLCQRGNQRMLDRLFTPAEQAYCQTQAQPAASLCARFCAKEAVMKCLGTGWTRGVRFCDIEVLRTADGRVGIALHGRAAALASELGIDRIHLSLTHANGMATAVAVAEGP